MSTEQTFPPRWSGSQFKHDSVPAVVQRHTRKKEKADALTEAYAVVDKRDGGKCAVTGRQTQPGAASAALRREHHHLRGRNVMPEYRERSERIVTVCAEAHALITAGMIVVEGDDARKPLRFHWRADVPKEQRIFVIKSRRRSQQR